MLESKVALYIMPVSTAVAMNIPRSTVEKNIGDLPLGQYLLERWYTHIDGARHDRVLWDLALIAAFIHPEMATLTKVNTSRDSGNRTISFYSAIDASAIYADFYESLRAFKIEP